MLIKCFVCSCLVGGMVMFSNLATVNVQQPDVNLVPREFLLWIPAETAETDWPNTRRTLSLMLFADTRADDCLFDHCFLDNMDQPEALRGTNWKMGAHQMYHVTKGEGPNIYKVAWKNVPAPWGATADSANVTGEFYWITPIPKSKDSEKAVVWQVGQACPKAVAVFVGTGLFSK